MATLNKTLFIDLFVDATLYGAYLASFLLCIRWLLFADEGWRVRRNIDWCMTFVAVIIFMSATVRIGAKARLTVDVVMAGFNERQVYELGAITVAALSVVVLVTDAVMIYRCWVVHSGSWGAMLLPVLFWFGCLISATLVFYYNNLSYKAGTQGNWALAQALHIRPAFYTCNLATNTYTTTAIIFRIYRTTNAGYSSLSIRVKYICRTLAEAGLLYTLSTFIAAISFLTFMHSSPNITFPLVAEAINFAMACIIFNAIITTVGQNRSGTRSNTEVLSE